MDNNKAQSIKEMSSIFNNIAEILNNKNEIDYLDGAKIDFL